MFIRLIWKLYRNSFNRYIVECKLEQGIENAMELTGFNRYIVECKLK